MKPIMIILLSVFALVSSCKKEAQTPTEVSNNPQVEVSKPAKESKNFQTLSKDQLTAFFPEYVGANKRFNIFIIPRESMGTASYGSFDSSYNYSINDCIKDDSVIKNFEVSYNASYNAPEGTEYVIKERDGFKTIAFLQPKINRYDIQFVYKNRFKLVLEGPEHPDVLWSYIKQEDLEKLDNY